MAFPENCCEPSRRPPKKGCCVFSTFAEMVYANVQGVGYFVVRSFPIAVQEIEALEVAFN